MNSLSSSGARISGDDYQHLLGWVCAVESCFPHNNVTHLGIEDPRAGNADDVTIYRNGNSKEFIQVKFSVDGHNKLADIQWLKKLSRSGGASIIQGLFAVWEEQSGNDCKIKIKLYTNRPASGVDGFISVRDGKNGTVISRISNAVKKDLVDHLKTTEEKVEGFLGDLVFGNWQLYDELRKYASICMYCAGLRYDDEAVNIGESIVRKWVTNGKRKLAVSKLRKEVEVLKRPDDIPHKSLLIQAIDRYPVPETATFTLDWVELFDGDEPRVRRKPKDSGMWNDKFRQEIQQAAKLLKSSKDNRILIRGLMRLPTWFTTGVEFGKTAGFEEVVSFQGGEPWSSKGAQINFPVKVVKEKNFSNGSDIAIGISASVDLSDDVLSYINTGVLEVNKYICITPKAGVGNTIFKSDKEVRDWAYNTRDIVRAISRKYNPTQVHLFLAVPSGAALLLGHLWDRMPKTQLYEDGGAVGLYTPSFFIPN